MQLVWVTHKFDLRQLNEAGQIEHRNLPVIAIAGLVHMDQIEHRSSPLSINVGSMIATESSHKMDSSENRYSVSPHMED